MSLLIYLGAGALIGALMRWWRPGMGWPRVGVYWLLAGALFAVPLTTRALQVPTDIAYRWLPWRDMVERRPVAANDLLFDVPLQMIPFRTLVRERLLHFEAPLWAHEIGTGQPLLGDAQSAPFSPLGLLTLPLPPVRALPVAAALKLFVSLLLMDALLTLLGAASSAGSAGTAGSANSVGSAGAVFGAVAYSFSVYSICWALHPLGTAMAWLPGVMLGLVLLRREERGGLAGLVVCGTAMALSGHPETLAFTALAAGAVVVALLVAGESSSGATSPGAPSQGATSSGAGRLIFLRRLAVAVVLCAGLSAPALLPFVEAVPDSTRAQEPPSVGLGTLPLPFEASRLILAVNPLEYGSPRDRDWRATRLKMNYNEVCSGYAGLLALALAAAGAFVLRGRVLAIFAGGAVALAAAFGAPPFIGMVEALPLFDHALTGRLRLLWVLAVAAGSGLALEPLAARRDGRWIAAACAAAAALGLACARQPDPFWQRVWWFTAVGACAATAAAFAWAARSAALPSGSPRRLPSLRWLPWLAVVCLGLDLGALNWRYLPVVPANFDLAPPPALRVLAAAAGTGTEPRARVTAAGDVLFPNLPAAYGLWGAGADDPMRPAQVSKLVVQALSSTGRDPVGFLGLLGVRYLLTHHGFQAGPPWEPLWEGQGGRIWQNPRALPLFFMPAAVRQAPGADAALAATLALDDYAATAIVEAPAIGLPPVSRGPQGCDQVRLVAVRANGFELAPAGPAAGCPGGLVASSVTFARGWRLTVDGEPSPLLRVDAAFLGFAAPAGWQRAVLDYRPAAWVWGVRWCAATVVALLVAWLVALRSGGGPRRRGLRGTAPAIAGAPGAPAAPAADAAAHSAAISAQQTMALQTELQRPKPL
jgi:hypothetical protein